MIPTRPFVLGGVTFDGRARPDRSFSDADAAAHAVADALLGRGGPRRHRSAFSRHRRRSGKTPTRSCCCAPSRCGPGRGLRDRQRRLHCDHRRRRSWRRSGTRWRRTSATAIDVPVTVKATRPEALGALGRGEGLACLAVALIVARSRLMPRPPAAEGPGPVPGGPAVAARSRRRRDAAARRRARPRRPDRRRSQCRARVAAAGRRPVREIFFADGIDPAPILEDIASLAAKRRRADPHVSRVRASSSMAETEAPQGVVARAARAARGRSRRPAPTRPGVRRRSWSRSTGSPTPTTSAPSSARAESAGATGIVSDPPSCRPRHADGHQDGRGGDRAHADRRGARSAGGAPGAAEPGRVDGRPRRRRHHRQCSTCRSADGPSVWSSGAKDPDCPAWSVSGASSSWASRGSGKLSR